VRIYFSFLYFSLACKTNRTEPHKFGLTLGSARAQSKVWTEPKLKNDFTFWLILGSARI